MATSILEDNMANAMSIEAIASLRELQLCLHQGISKLIIQIDCLFVVDELSSCEDPISDLGNDILEIRELMPHFFYCKSNMATA